MATRHEHWPTLLETIAERAQLEEGGEAVRNIVREVFRSEKIGTKELAFRTQLPIPVTAAVRRELEIAGLLDRDGGAYLTPEGKRFAKEQLGLIHQQELSCPACQGRRIDIPDGFLRILNDLRKCLGSRPKPLPWLDQAHGTPETALRRAVYMLEVGDIDGRRIIFLGDDDFTSVAVGLLKASRDITVVDIDSRLLESIQMVSTDLGLNITCVESDLRKPLPRSLQHSFDVVFTDPPYTLAGFTLFVSRGIEALQKRQGAVIYLSFAHQSPRKTASRQRLLNAMGLAIVEHIPRFNTYEGAEMYANTTSLTRLLTTGQSKPLTSGHFQGKLYTGEITQTVRTYRCPSGHQVNVGVSQDVRTIEELKTRGCPKCGTTKGFELKEKIRVKDTLPEKLVLRDFQWKDFPVILEFERRIAERSFPEAPILDSEYHQQKLQKSLERKTDYLKVATLSGEVVGWLWLRTEKDRSTNERFGYIKSIIVKPEHRRQGFGKRLLENAEQYFEGKGIRRVDLIVSASNYEGDMFFQEMGFQDQHSTMRKALRHSEA